MDPVVVFPDAAELVINWLLAQTTGITVAGLAPGPAELEASLPLAVVDRVGGTRHRRKVLDGPFLDVNVYAATPAATWDAAEEVRAQIEALRNTVHTGAVVTDSEEISGPQARPEFNRSVFRVGFTVSLMIRPN